MSKLQNDYEAIAHEIKSLHQEIKSIGKNNLKIRSLYKGCHILFSPLIYKPHYLLIGFNPGGGYYKHHGKIAENFQSMPKLEYYLSDHKLGQETKDVFVSSGLGSELERSSVKINFYPWATNHIDDFNDLISILPKDLKVEIFHKARVWNRKIIDKVEPEIIICEGFAAFREVEALFETKNNYAEDKNTIYFESYNNTKIFAYKRCLSSIINKSEVSTKLKKLN